MHRICDTRVVRLIRLHAPPAVTESRPRRAHAEPERARDLGRPYHLCGRRGRVHIGCVLISLRATLGAGSDQLCVVCRRGPLSLGHQWRGVHGTMACRLADRSREYFINDVINSSDKRYSARKRPRSNSERTRCVASVRGAQGCLVTAVVLTGDRPRGVQMEEYGGEKSSRRPVLQ